MTSRRALVAALALLLAAPALTLPVGAQEPAPLPDLMAESVDVGGQPLFEGDPLLVCFRVHNGGNADAGAFVAEVWVDGSLVGERPFFSGFNGTSALAAGNSTSGCLFAVWQATPGLHTLELVVDADGEVPESEEGNNNLASTFRVFGRDDVDVAVLGARFFFGPPTASGDQVAVLATVANLGAVTLLFDVGTFVDGVFHARNFVFLAPGQTLEMFLGGPSAAPGPHVLTIRADALDERAERDEGNNEATLTYSVQAPDLVVEGVEVRPARPDAGLPATLEARVRNAGPGLARFPNVDLEVDGERVSTQQLGSLVPGEGAMVRLPWLFPQGGEHRFTVTADPLGLLFDRDGSDNQGRVDFRVVQPDLAVAGIVAARRPLETEVTGPLAPNPLTPLEVRVDVANLGDGRAWRAANATAAYALTLTACARIEIPLPRGPLPLPWPLPTVEPPTPPEERCEQVAQWTARDDLAAGATRTFDTSWDTRGRVGDFELCARLTYPNPQGSVDNDLGCRRVAVLVGGTGLGGFYLFP